MRYAIGEIVLVVIGILIALSINNWNENRINKLKETQFLESFKEDLKSHRTERGLNSKRERIINVVEV